MHNIVESRKDIEVIYGIFGGISIILNSRKIKKIREVCEICKIDEGLFRSGNYGLNFDPDGRACDKVGGFAKMMFTLKEYWNNNPKYNHIYVIPEDIAVKGSIKTIDNNLRQKGFSAEGCDTLLDIINKYELTR
ncbi:hypothetical protein GF361_03705 [Candidatus Woesearchaeota archaeon]|nr:hypothetical protein [Candidatus Woesearchaeota archaeon]